MKRIYLLYNNLTKQYIINEEGKPIGNNVPASNIKKNLDEVLDFFVTKYGKRNILVVTNHILPQADYETLEFFVKEKLPKAKIGKEDE